MLFLAPYPQSREGNYDCITMFWLQHQLSVLDYFLFIIQGISVNHLLLELQNNYYHGCQFFIKFIMEKGYHQLQ